MKLIYSRIRKKEKEAASDKISVAAFLNVVGCVFLKKKTRITTGTGIREGKKLFPWISVYIIYLMDIAKQVQKCSILRTCPKNV